MVYTSSLPALVLVVTFIAVVPGALPCMAFAVKLSAGVGLCIASLIDFLSAVPLSKLMLSTLLLLLGKLFKTLESKVTFIIYSLLGSRGSLY